ncbi:DndE family protein [Christiangramia marina]|uniref:DndE family protein n=1 Tax=Christiangramia marina TaxID=409436 RepID=UPI003AA7EC5E
MSYTHIRTSRDNREVVTTLTNKLGLGAENLISRIALSYSISKDLKLDLKDLKDSQGKEYARKVLLGNNADYYEAMVAQHYNIHRSDHDMAKYIKLHVDNGLELLNEEFQNGSYLDQFDFVLELIEEGFNEIKAS